MHRMNAKNLRLLLAIVALIATWNLAQAQHRTVRSMVLTMSTGLVP
jgi:hypothetical protein